MKKLTLQYLPDIYTIHRFDADQALPETLERSGFYAVTRTEEELSVVCKTGTLLPKGRSEGDWLCFKVLGPLDFALTGILAKLATTLAEASISIFAISTFDTDYVLHKRHHEPQAVQALKRAGYVILKEAAHLLPDKNEALTQENDNKSQGVT